MKIALRLIALSLTMLIVFFAVACAPRAEVAPVCTPEPTVSVTAALTAIPTATPSPEPIPAPIFSEARMAELNQQMQDFLNKQGEFTPEKMSSKMMVTTSYLDHDKVCLGISDQEPALQGYLFDYFEKEGRLFLITGFDGKDGNRFITPLEITLYLYEAVEPAVFTVTRAEEKYIGSSISNEGDIDYGKRDKLIPLLDSIKGNTFCFYLRARTFTEDKALVDEFGQVIVENLNEINSKVKLSFGLFQLVTSNDLDYKNPENIEGDTSYILKLENIEDFCTINIDNVPLINAIHYFLEEDK